MNTQETIDKFIDNFNGEHQSTYFSGEHYATSRDRVVDFVRVDYETYDEDPKTIEEIKEDIRGLITRDFPDLLSRFTLSHSLYEDESREPFNVDIFHGVTFKRYTRGKKATSYTIYLAVAVEW